MMSKGQRETDSRISQQEVSLGQDRIPRTAAEVSKFMRHARKHMTARVPICGYGPGTWRERAADTLWFASLCAARNPDPMLEKETK